MAKDDLIEMEGTVIDTLPNAMFKVKTTVDTEVLAHLSAKLRTHFIRILTGDKVIVQVSPYDPSRGRIIWRMK